MSAPAVETVRAEVVSAAMQHAASLTGCTDLNRNETDLIALAGEVKRLRREVRQYERRTL